MIDPVQEMAPYEEHEDEQIFEKVLRGYSTHSEMSQKSRAAITRCYDDIDKGHDAGGLRLVRNL